MGRKKVAGLASPAAAVKAEQCERASEKLTSAAVAVAHAAATLVDGATDHDSDAESMVVEKSDFDELVAKIKAWSEAGEAFLSTVAAANRTKVTTDTPETVAAKAKSARAVGDAFNAAFGGKS